MHSLTFESHQDAKESHKRNDPGTYTDLFVLVDDHDVGSSRFFYLLSQLDLTQMINTKAFRTVQQNFRKLISGLLSDKAPSAE